MPLPTKVDLADEIEGVLCVIRMYLVARKSLAEIRCPVYETNFIVTQDSHSTETERERVRERSPLYDVDVTASKDDYGRARERERVRERSPLYAVDVTASKADYGRARVPCM